MVEIQPLTTQEIIARRRALLYNIKARNLKMSDIFSDVSKKAKDLEIEREKIATILMNKAGIKNVDEMLYKVNVRREKDEDKFYGNNRNK